MGGDKGSGRLSTPGLRSYFFYEGCIEDLLKPREGSGHCRTVDDAVVIDNAYGHFAFAVYHSVIQGCRQRRQGMQRFSIQPGINRHCERTEEVRFLPSKIQSNPPQQSTQRTGSAAKRIDRWKSLIASIGAVEAWRRISPMSRSGRAAGSLINIEKRPSSPW